MSHEALKKELLDALIKEKVFWSYQVPDCNIITDELLIENTLIHLDLEHLDLLFQIFSGRKIRQVWEDHILQQEPYYHSLNLFLAWYYFGIANPREYIKNNLK
ncbi:MAG: hypothetical protein R6W78_16110 [Bacteroidales bacterium]